MSGYGSCTVHV
eukprot:Gb_31154 [translate_table: standard]